jgi:uncharacterized damage-inducible protein DinB
MEIRDIDSFLAYFASVRGRTMRVAACVPPEHLEWSYRPGTFTPGDLLRHLAATERYQFTENVHGRPSRYRGCGRELADGYEAVIAFVERMHAESVDLLRALTPADLQRPCQTPGGTTITTWKWLRAMIEHEVHHRGQLYTLLGMLGAPTPPLFGLREDQVRQVG